MTVPTLHRPTPDPSSPDPAPDAPDAPDPASADPAAPDTALSERAPAERAPAGGATAELATVVRLPVRSRAGLPVAGAPGGARPRVCRPPALEPPYDDECGAAPVPRRWDQPLPFEQLAREPAGGDFGPRPTRRADLPDPEQWVSVLAQALLETLAGRRSPAQLREWTSTGAYTSVVAVSGRDRWAGQRRGAPPLVRSVRVDEPADGVAEAAVVAQLGDRCLAVALRLEGLDGRWQCTAIRVG